MFLCYVSLEFGVCLYNNYMYVWIYDCDASLRCCVDNYMYTCTFNFLISLGEFHESVFHVACERLA